MAHFESFTKGCFTPFGFNKWEVGDNLRNLCGCALTVTQRLSGMPATLGRNASRSRFCQ